MGNKKIGNVLPIGKQEVTIGTIVKLASIAVHAEDLLSPDGHHFDRLAIESLLKDEEVVSLLATMDDLALAPKKRTTPPGRDATGKRIKRKAQA